MLALPLISVLLSILVGSIVINYALGRATARARAMARNRLARAILVVALTFDFGVLAYFKYSNFLLSNFAASVRGPRGLLGPDLPFDQSPRPERKKTLRTAFSQRQKARALARAQDDGSHLLTKRGIPRLGESKAS